MEEYLSVTIISNPGEAAADFSARLSRFWTYLLRTKPDQYAKVYAEAREFSRSEVRLSRQYLIEECVAELLQRELKNACLDCAPVDLNDIYTKYEAVPAEWLQIQH